MDDRYFEEELGKLATKHSAAKLPKSLENKTRLLIREEIYRRKKGRISVPKLKTLGFIPAVLGLMIFAFVSTLMIIQLASNPARELNLSHQELDLVVEDSFILTVEGFGLDELVWSSNNIAVATVDQAGEVRGVGPGTALITVAAGERSASCIVSVSQQKMLIRLEPSELTLYVGETREFTAVVDSSLSGDIVWSIEDTSIVDLPWLAIPRVRGIGVGKTRLIASLEGYQASATITVEPLPASLNLKEVDEFVIRPTGYNISFSPDSDMFVYYQVALGDYAELMDFDGNQYALPKHGEPHFGPVSWHGSKLIYHVLGWEGESNPEGAIYIYDVRSHTHQRITGDFAFIGLQPVLNSAYTVLVVLPDGLWEYDLTQRVWIQRFAFQVGDIQRLTWSPDLNRVAWVESGGVDKLIVLDVNSGEISTLSEQSSITEIAWADDGLRLAIAGSEIKVISLDGEVISLPQREIINLNWVPGQNKLSFSLWHTMHSFLTIVDISSGEEMLDGRIRHQHYWLPNGNLAQSVGYDEEENWEIVKVHSIEW